MNGRSVKRATLLKAWATGFVVSEGSNVFLAAYKNPTIVHPPYK